MFDNVHTQRRPMCKRYGCTRDTVVRGKFTMKFHHFAKLYLKCHFFHSQDAIVALNGLQTNANTVKESIGRAHNTDCPHIKETEKYLNKIGVSLNDLDKLSVIHVAGTKGKGSTCALVESMLRHLNVKTGFYSSPHLVNVTERIRLNGQPITKRLFSQYFWKIYSTLEQTKVYWIELLFFLTKCDSGSAKKKNRNLISNRFVFPFDRLGAATRNRYAAVFQISHHNGVLCVSEGASRCGRCWGRHWRRIRLHKCCSVSLVRQEDANDAWAMTVRVLKLFWFAINKWILTEIQKRWASLHWDWSTLRCSAAHSRILHGKRVESLSRTVAFTPSHRMMNASGWWKNGPHKNKYVYDDGSSTRFVHSLTQ